MIIKCRRDFRNHTELGQLDDSTRIPIAGDLVEIPKFDYITRRNRTRNYATTEFSGETVQNQETNANRIVYSAQQYQNDMNAAIEKQAGAQIVVLIMGDPRQVQDMMRRH